jgi:thermostable 8-oxoguanine DNA glycosylase
MYDLIPQGVRSCALPPAASEVMPGVTWGAFDEIYTPAFWAGRAWQLGSNQLLERYRLGPSLAHELVACVLGGYGIPAEVGLAAYERLRAADIPERITNADELARLLAEPLVINGRQVRYRFAQKKARQLAAALEALPRSDVEQLDDRALRAVLMTLPGIGPKTASWITRNWRGSDAVAILDIHICRACVLAKVFTASADPAREYFRLEDRFLAFAAALEVRASILDNLMWQTMRGLGSNVHQTLRASSAGLPEDRDTHGSQRRRRTNHAPNDLVAVHP